MPLSELVKKYLELAGEFGRPVELARFGMDRAQTERVFGVYDEDYHISRYLHLANTDGAHYTINAFPQTHVTIDAAIREIL